MGKHRRLTRFCTQSNWTKTLSRFAYFCSCSMDHDILVDLYDLLIVLSKRDILGSIDVRQSGISSNTILLTYPSTKSGKWRYTRDQTEVRGIHPINAIHASEVWVKVFVSEDRNENKNIRANYCRYADTVDNCCFPSIWMSKVDMDWTSQMATVYLI